MSTVEVRLRRLLGMRPRDPEDVPAPPRVRLALAGAVPGVVVRLAPSVLVVVCTVLTAAHTGLWLAGLAAAFLVAWRPQWPTIPGVLLVIGTWVLAGDDRLAVAEASGGGLLRVVGLVVGMHLLVRAGALSRHVVWGGLVEVPVVLRALRSVVAVQVVVQALLLATVWLRANLGLSAAGQGWVRLVGVAAVVAVVLLVLPRAWTVQRPPRPEEAVRYE